MVETVQKTVESPQLVLLLDKVVDVPVLATSWGCRGSVRSCSSSTGVSAHHGYDELMRRLFRAVSVAILAQVRRLSLGIFGGLGGCGCQPLARGQRIPICLVRKLVCLFRNVACR